MNSKTQRETNIFHPRVRDADFQPGVWTDELQDFGSDAKKTAGNEPLIGDKFSRREFE